MPSRRTLLAGVSATVLLKTSPSLSWTHGSPLPPGQVVINVGPYTNSAGEFPFINMMLGAQGFSSVSGFAFPSVLNIDNYPVTASLAQDINNTVPVPGLYTDPATVWVFEWTGTQGTVGNPGMQLVGSGGGFAVTVGSEFVSGVTTSTLNTYGTNGSIEFTFNGAHPSGSIPFKFIAAANFDGSLANVALYRKTQQAAYRAGNVFNPDYVSTVRALRPKAVRMLNWILANGNNNIANAAQAARSTSITFGPRWDPSIWAGSASGTNTYTATLSGVGALVDGTSIQLQFTSANTSAPTLNLNGFGAISIAGMDGAAISAASTITAASLWTLVYDAGLNVWLGLNSGLQSGVPTSLQCLFANQLGCDLWVNIPGHATDAFANTIITSVRDNLNATGWFEYCNEVWNTAAGFAQTAWATARGAALGFPSASGQQYHGWYALRVRQIMASVATIYGVNSRYKRVLAFQAFGDPVAIPKYRMNGFDLNGTNFPLYASAGYPNYDMAPNRPVDFADVFSYATYYSGAQLKNASTGYANTMTTDGPPGYTVGLLGAADDYATSIPANMANALSWVDWDFRQGTRNGVASTQTLVSLSTNANLGIGAIGVYPTWNTVAVTYNLPIANYEGAMEATFLTAAKCTSLGISTSYGDVGGKVNVLLTAYKMNSLFQTLVTDQMNQFMGNSKSLYPAWYEIGVNDQWALYSPNIYSTPFASQAAIVGYRYP